MVPTERFILGPEVQAFEEEFADYLGVAHCVGVANGTEALAIALRALGVGRDDEVIVPCSPSTPRRRRWRPSAGGRCSATSTATRSA